MWHRTEIKGQSGYFSTICHEIATVAYGSLAMTNGRVEQTLLSVQKLNPLLPGNDVLTMDTFKPKLDASRLTYHQPPL